MLEALLYFYAIGLVIAVVYIPVKIILGDRSLGSLFSM